MPDRINRSEGRRLFGLDPEGYDATRPRYPSWIFEELTASKALFHGAATVEIGPGSGLATMRLIEHGADPLTLIEPDDRFAPMLRRAIGQRPSCQVLHQSFEDATLTSDEFDLAVAATSFHWIEPVAGRFVAVRVGPASA
jgi:phospholipid N-methyltransferase